MDLRNGPGPRDWSPAEPASTGRARPIVSRAAVRPMASRGARDRFPWRKIRTLFLIIGVASGALWAVTAVAQFLPPAPSSTVLLPPTAEPAPFTPAAEPAPAAPVAELASVQAVGTVAYLLKQSATMTGGFPTTLIPTSGGLVVTMKGSYLLPPGAAFSYTFDGVAAYVTVATATNTASWDSVSDAVTIE